MHKPNQDHDLYFDKPVSRWDEAIPLGNGLTGCLIWGDGNPLRLSLDRGDLWDRRVADETLVGDFKYDELLRLVRTGEHEAVTERFERFYSKPTPTKIPAGRLELDFFAPCDRASSHLNLYDATAEVRLEFKGKYSEVRVFTHAADPIGCISIRGTAPMPELKICSPKYADQDSNGVEGGSLALLGYPPAVIGRDDSLSWFHQNTGGDLEYAIITAQKKTDDSLEIAYTIASNLDGENWLENAKAMVAKAVGIGFDKVKITHNKWWADFWAKSSITLPNKEFEKQWYVTNYLFGSCSRQGAPPMPLQGVWTADEGQLPPWKGDYHSDLNTQMSYWHYMKANHLPEGRSFVDFLWDLIPAGRRFARDFYDAPGLCMPSVMSIDGKPLGGWVQYSLCLTSQAWLCQAFDHYWRHSGDDDFLRDRAYPYLKESADCICRWLTPGEDGKLRLPLSCSPEIHSNTSQAWLTPNSNFDLSLLKYLFRTLQRMADLLDNGENGQWRELNERLPDLAVNENNILMISPDESLLESHRHHSHALAIYPLNLLNYHASPEDKAVIDATISDLEMLGSEFWVGYSFPWMAALYSRQGNGEGAAHQLKLFWESFCAQNGFHLNGDFKEHGVCAAHYRPFTLEGNMAAAAALQEMLLQTHDGVIRVFPAIPNAWREEGLSFHGFRGEGAVLISAEISDGKFSMSLNTEKEGTFHIQNNFGSDKLVINNRHVEHCNQGDIFTVKLAEGEACRIQAHLDD